MNNRTPGELLRDWRTRNGVSQAALAALAGVTQPAISHYEAGTNVPGLRCAQLIERATRGEVPASAWVELPPEATEEPAP